MKPSDLITSALRRIGIVAIDETPSDAANTHALGLLTEIVANLPAALATAPQNVNYPLVVGQATYTWGTGGDFNAAAPAEILGAYLRDANSVDSPLKPWPLAAFERQADKAVSGRPARVLPRRTYPFASLTFDRAPDQAYTLYVDGLFALVVPALAAETNWPPEYQRALAVKLAVELAPAYNKPVSPALATSLTKAWNALSARNVRVNVLTVDRALQPYCGEATDWQWQ